MKQLFFFAALTFCATQLQASDHPLSKLSSYRTAQTYTCGKTCGKVRSCKEAVYQWCACGYSRADADKDGVPCETVCGQSTPSNVSKVKTLRQELGC